MAPVLDNLDRAILSTLQRDATMSVDAISDAVHLSRNACWRRIKRMEDNGVIRGRAGLVEAIKMAALLDPAMVGCPLTVMVLIRTHRHDTDWLDRFQSTLKSLPEVTGAARLAGDLDYLLTVRVADVAAYDAFYKRLIDKVPVSDISASFVMEEIKATTALPL